MHAKILALDTSTENCSVALRIDDQIYTQSEVAPRDHTKKILPMVDSILKQAGLKLADLDAIAFGQGPGSFTGVRIGIGIAQGLAFGANVPLIGISTLKAMAQGSYRCHQAEQVATAIDARMGEVYWAQYQRQNDGDWQGVSFEIETEHNLASEQTEVVIAPDVLLALKQSVSGQWCQAGTGWQTYANELSQLALETQAGDVLYPQAQDIAYLAQFAWQRGEAVTASDAEPTYLRDKVTWKKLPGRE
ncbi:MAG: tRNA (adenosine(37)-N6)-threonylcarbamoyltransferase complex dimerization subunit type 1 TsaB [Vibrio sp.]